MCLSFDCDLQEDMDQIPSLLDLLRAEEIVTGFALVGQLASQYPMTVHRIIDEGHEILNHSFSHPGNFRILGSQQKKSQIESFQGLMISSFNHKPKGFRAPHLMTSYDEDFFAALKEAGLYDSSYVGHGVSNINDVWEIALTSCPEHRKLSFDLYSHFQFPFFASSINKFLDLWSSLIAKEHFINVYFDPNFMPYSLLRYMIKMGKKKGFSFIRMSDVIKQIS